MGRAHILPPLPALLTAGWLWLALLLRRWGGGVRTVERERTAGSWAGEDSGLWETTVRLYPPLGQAQRGGG